MNVDHSFHFISTYMLENLYKISTDFNSMVKPLIYSFLAFDESDEYEDWRK